VLELLQRSDPEAEPASLGVFEFGPISSPRKNYAVDVTVAYDREGIVQVHARDPQTGSVMESSVRDRSAVSSAHLAVQADWISGLPINL
jgi:molecular chaperone DnaK (HSP70)